MKRNRRIVILSHENYRYRPTHNYVVHYLADFWKEWGFGVRYLYGVDHFEPADLLFMHVDLSVVPKEYMEFALNYPVTVNLGISDIRKSRISTNIIGKADEWRGPVIVKSDLNFGGLPEMIRTRSRIRQRSIFDPWWPIMRKLRAKTTQLFRTTRSAGCTINYEIFDDLTLVPVSRLSNSRFVIERFLPELEGGLYFTRVYQFLGDRSICFRMGSRSPIVKAGNCVFIEKIEPHESVETWRKNLNIDYGKIDYVMFNGQPFLIDVNKTIGAANIRMVQLLSSEEIVENRRELAEGIYSFF